MYVNAKEKNNDTRLPGNPKMLDKTDKNCNMSIK